MYLNIIEIETHRSLKGVVKQYSVTLKSFGRRDITIFIP